MHVRAVYFRTLRSFFDDIPLQIINKSNRDSRIFILHRRQGPSYSAHCQITALPLSQFYSSRPALRRTSNATKTLHFRNRELVTAWYRLYKKWILEDRETDCLGLTYYGPELNSHERLQVISASLLNTISFLNKTSQWLHCVL
jgi:hypothetical protein